MRGKRLALALVALLLLGGGAGGYWVMRSNKAAAAAKPRVVPVAADVPEVITNLADGHYAQVALTVELAGPQAARRFARRHAAIEDAIIGTLRSRTSQQLDGGKGMQSLGDALAQAMDRTLGGQDVLHVYFTRFVVQ
jgi:flagellar FliL protein